MMRAAVVRMVDGIAGGAVIAVSGSKGEEMKRTFLILMILVAAQTVSAQDWAKEKLLKSPRHGEWVTVKHDGRSVETFVVYPESRDKRPVVLIIHEIFGMTDWVQDLADQVAAAGYIARRLDALAGAIVEYLAKQHKLGRVPPWASKPARFLDRPWHACPFENDAMREYLTFASPAEFASRNIFTEERPLRRARSPFGRQIPDAT